MRTPEILGGASWNEPMPVDLDQFHERAVAWAVKRFNDKPADETLLGYFIFAGDGHTTVVHAPWENEQDKYALAAALREMLADPMGKHLVEAYAFITEAWAVKLDPDTDPSLKGVPPPSQHPDREDVLNIWSTQRDGTTKMTRFGVRIYQNPLPWLPPKKKPRLLERDDHFGDGGEMVGTLFNFFDSLAESRKKMKRAEAKARREQKQRKQEKSDDNG
jgi:hypothetical protein